MTPLTYKPYQYGHKAPSPGALQDAHLSISYSKSPLPCHAHTPAISTPAAENFKAQHCISKFTLVMKQDVGRNAQNNTTLSRWIEYSSMYLPAHILEIDTLAEQSLTHHCCPGTVRMRLNSSQRHRSRGFIQRTDALPIIKKE